MTRTTIKSMALLVALVVCFTVIVAEKVPPVVTSGGPTVDVATNTHYLEQYLMELTDHYEGEDGRWIFELYDVEMLLLSDEPTDRMRLIAAVADAAEIDDEEVRTILAANFDRALDAKYALWNGTLWAVYLHPLSHLRKDEFREAVKQVASLHHNYGMSYSSSGMLYRIEYADDDEADDE